MRDSVIPGSQLHSGLTGLGHFIQPSTLWTDGDSVTSDPGILASVIPSPMVIQAPGTVWISGIYLVQPPRCPGNGWTQSFQPPGIFETGETQSFSPRVISSPQIPLGQAGSLFSIAQEPWRLERLNNSRLSAIFGTSGPRSSQLPKTLRTDGDAVTLAPPRYFGHWQDSVIPSPMFLKAPGTVGNHEIQFVDTPRCPGDGWAQSVQPSGILETGRTQTFQPPESFQPPGTLGTGGISIFSCPGTLRTSETQQFQAPRYLRD